jgi:hypothetical protein
MVAGSAPMAPRDNPGKLVHPVLRTIGSHFHSGTAGLQVSWYSWLRRTPWLF